MIQSARQCLQPLTLQCAVLAECFRKHIARFVLHRIERAERPTAVAVDLFEPITRAYFEKLVSDL